MDIELEPVGPPAVDLPRDISGVSIVIPAYEDKPVLRRAIWSITQTVDLPVQLVVAMARQSVARNRNDGLARAKHDLVVFMDDDVLLPAHWLSQLAAVLLADESIGVVSARMTGPAGEPQNDLARLRPGEVRDCIPPGTCFLYSRSRVRGCRFDDRYVRSQWEDSDFMLQVLQAGLRCVATGSVTVLHENHLTRATDESWVENRKYFFSKWPRFEAIRDQVYGSENPETSASYAAS
jgi:glycosyltransferase involved in cell wall biosynthesis